MRQICRHILLFLALVTGLFLGMFAVASHPTPAASTCVLSIALVLLPHRGTPASTTPTKFLEMPPLREDRMLIRINSAFARPNSKQSDIPEFDTIEHRGSR